MILATLDVLGHYVAALHAAIAADQAARPAAITGGWTDSGKEREIDFLGIDDETYLSQASWAKEIRWTGRPRVFPKLPVFDDKPGLLLKQAISVSAKPSKTPPMTGISSTRLTASAYFPALTRP